MLIQSLANLFNNNYNTAGILSGGVTILLDWIGTTGPEAIAGALIILGIGVSSVIKAFNSIGHQKRMDQLAYDEQLDINRNNKRRRELATEGEELKVILLRKQAAA